MPRPGPPAGHGRPKIGFLNRTAERIFLKKVFSYSSDVAKEASQVLRLYFEKTWGPPTSITGIAAKVGAKYFQASPSYSGQLWPGLPALLTWNGH